MVMQRFAEVDLVYEEELRAAEVAKAPIEDDDLTDRVDEQGNPTLDPNGILIDRRDRPEVCYYLDANGRWKPTDLKRGDHVMFAQMLPVRVIGPARGRGFFLAYWPEGNMGGGLLTLPVENISDRAPLDENATPMPLFPGGPEAS